ADHPAVDVLVRAERPEASPLTERLRARVSWPPAGRRSADTDDPVFPEGLDQAVELERAAPGTLEARVPPGQADAFRSPAEGGRPRRSAAPAPGRRPPGPRPRAAPPCSSLPGWTRPRPVSSRHGSSRSARYSPTH